MNKRIYIIIIQIYKNISSGDNVFRNYYDSNITAENVTFIPLGVKTGFLNKNENLSKTKNIHDMSSYKKLMGYKDGGALAKKAKSALSKTDNALVVVCKSEGNPDYGQYTSISEVELYPVNTLKVLAVTLTSLLCISEPACNAAKHG